MWLILKGHVLYTLFINWSVVCTVHVHINSLLWVLWSGEFGKWSFRTQLEWNQKASLHPSSIEIHGKLWHDCDDFLHTSKNLLLTWIHVIEIFIMCLWAIFIGFHWAGLYIVYTSICQCPILLSPRSPMRRYSVCSFRPSVTSLDF